MSVFTKKKHSPSVNWPTGITVRGAGQFSTARGWTRKVKMVTGGHTAQYGRALLCKECTLLAKICSTERQFGKHVPPPAPNSSMCTAPVALCSRALPPSLVSPLQALSRRSKPPDPMFAADGTLKKTSAGVFRAMLTIQVILADLLRAARAACHHDAD